METKGGEHGFNCVCEQTCTKVDNFLKILDLADIGLKIYRYLATKYAKVSDVTHPTPGTRTDVFILQNTRDKDLPASSFIQGLDANKISCPKCKQVVAHAKRLIENIPSVNKGNVVAVCDHCRKIEERRYSCDVCDKIAKKFISSKKDDSKRYLIGRSQSDLNLRNIRSSPEKNKYGPVAATGYVTKSKWDDSLLEIGKQFEQKLKPCFVKSQHEGGKRDELRKHFQNASLIRSRSETFLNAVSGLTEEILDKTFHYYFPKGARQLITGKGEVSSEEFIRDTQEKYRLLTETKERIHEGTRISGTAEELGSQEYYDQYGKPIRVGKMPEVYYDQHGQLVRRGKTPHVYYDKHGQPIPGGVMPDIYYDKYGRPVQGRRMPEVFYDEHGQPVPAGPTSEVSYDKHGQTVSERQPPQVYYDEKEQPITDGRPPDVYYDKHDQPIPRGLIPVVYYDKYGQPFQKGKTPEVYYDKHGQLLRKGKTPEVYYDKHGKPIQGGGPPDVYFDQYGKPIEKGKSPEVYFDEHGLPVKREKTPDNFYDKHGQPIKGERPTEIYYDEHGQPVTRAKIPEVLYDKYGQPFTRDNLPEVYYNKLGQLIHRKRTPETYHDKHGRPVRRERTPEGHYDKDGQLTHEHRKPGGKGGNISEVFYDQHGKPVKGGRKGGHAEEVLNNPHGKPVHGGRSKGTLQKGLISSISSAGDSELDGKSKKSKTGRDEQAAKETDSKKFEGKEKTQIITEKKNSSRDEKDRSTIEGKEKPLTPSKDEKNIYSKDEKDRKVIEGKGKTEILSKVLKKYISEDEKSRKMVEGKDKVTQVPSKDEKQIIQDQTKVDRRDTLNQEKTSDKTKTTVKDDAGKTTTEKDKPKSKDAANQKTEEDKLKKQRLEELKKLKDAEEKDKKSVKASGDESKDKNVKQKDLASEGKVKQKDDKLAGDKQKEERKLGHENRPRQEGKRNVGKTEADKSKDMKQKEGDNVFEDKLKEAKRLREEKQNQEKANLQKQKGERDTDQKQKTEKKEKSDKNKEENLLRKVLDQQNKQKLEEEKFKKANADDLKKIKDTISKSAPQPIKVAETTAKPNHPQPFKIDEKLVSKSTKLVKKKSVEIPPNKELDIKAIQIMRPSNEDFLAKLVKVKPMKKAAAPIITEKELECLGKIHKSHTDDGLKDSRCNICVYSELQFQLEELAQKKIMYEKREVIIGNEVKKINAKDYAKVKEEKQEGPVPALFKTIFTIEPTADVDEKRSEELPPPVDEPSKTKPKQQQQQQTDQEPKGVIKYALSDRSFIDKGWTLLPTEKVVRKMNVYRMRPAHPEFDWFENNKNKRYMEYDSGDKLAEIDDNGRGRWFYRNGRVALDYYNAEETNAQQRFVIYSSGEPDERGRTHPYTVLGTFDYLGNGIVFDHGGKIRLKYNQSEGVVLDRSLGPVSHWKWHSLNDPPVLQQVMIDTQMSFKDPEILKLGDQTDDNQRHDNEEMLAIEFDNFIKEKSKKLTQKFKPFQIKMKALKINEQFSLRILDQATIYLLFRDGSTNLKLNMGMLLDHQEIVDTDTAEMGDVANNIEKLPARTDSIAGLQANISKAQREARLRLEHDRRLCPPVPRCSVDQMHAAASRPLRQSILPAPSSSATTSVAERHCIHRKPPYNNNLYYNTRII